MLYQIASAKPLDEIERSLQDAASRYRFSVIAIHDVRETLNKKGVDLAMECRIHEVRNPQQEKKVLDANAAVSTALPCRISVYGAPGHYTLATMLPTEMMKAFGDRAIEPVAREVEEIVIKIMQEAGGSQV